MHTIFVSSFEAHLRPDMSPCEADTHARAGTHTQTWIVGSVLLLPSVATRPGIAAWSANVSAATFIGGSACFAIGAGTALVDLAQEFVALRAEQHQQHQQVM